VLKFYKNLGTTSDLSTGFSNLLCTVLSPIHIPYRRISSNSYMQEINILSNHSVQLLYSLMMDQYGLKM